MRFNRLVQVIHSSLKSLQKALKGEVSQHTSTYLTELAAYQKGFSCTGLTASVWQLMLVVHMGAEQLLPQAAGCRVVLPRGLGCSTAAWSSERGPAEPT